MEMGVQPTARLWRVQAGPAQPPPFRNQFALQSVETATFSDLKPVTTTISSIQTDVVLPALLRLTGTATIQLGASQFASSIALTLSTSQPTEKAAMMETLPREMGAIVLARSKISGPVLRTRA